jgi:hypothetical protein
LKAEKDRINELKAAGAAFDRSEEQRLEAKLQREQQARIKTEQLQRQALRKQQALEISAAIVNNAGAVLKAHNSAKPPLNWILAGIQAALGAIQIAAIRSQVFESGGWVGGKRHKDGGTMIEAEKDEYVVSRGPALQSKKLLHMINTGAVSDKDMKGAGGSMYVDMNTTNDILTGISNKPALNQYKNKYGNTVKEFNGIKIIYS